MSRKRNPHWGTTLDAFLDGEGVRETVSAEARMRLEIVEAMRALHKTPKTLCGNEVEKTARRMLSKPHR